MSAGTVPLVLTSNETDLLALHRDPSEEPTPLRARSLFRWIPSDPEKTVQAHDPILVRVTGGTEYVPWLDSFLNQTKQADRRVLAVEGRADRGEADVLFRHRFSRRQAVGLDRLLAEAGRKNLQDLRDWLSRPSDSVPEPMVHGPVGRSDPGGSEPSPEILLLEYRARALSGDDRTSRRLADRFRKEGYTVDRLHLAGLRDDRALAALLERLREGDPVTDRLRAVISFLSFAASDPHEEHELFDVLDVPWVQGLQLRTSRADWEGNREGLNPGDQTMKLLFPEFDGRVAGSPCSFRNTVESEDLGTTLTRQAPYERGLRRLVRQVDGLVQSGVPDSGKSEAALSSRDGSAPPRRDGRGPNNEQPSPHEPVRLAVTLGHHPHKRGRVGNGVGLDTPASLLELLRDLKRHGLLTGSLPDSSRQLMDVLVRRAVSAGTDPAPPPDPVDVVPFPRYRDWLEEFPDRCRNQIDDHWGDPSTDPLTLPGRGIPVAGLQLGNLVILPQPPRGYELEADKIYHDTSLPPPHSYVATYRWLTRTWRPESIVHLGKHGTLEWLPGRPTALGEDDWPALLLEEIPLLYPFIINDPGEGTQAKRRTSARIISHLVPPQRETDLPDHLQPDNDRTPDPEELGLDPHANRETIRTQLDAIRSSDTRSGLHVLGEPPTGDRRTDFLHQLASGESNLPSSLPQILPPWRGKNPSWGGSRSGDSSPVGDEWNPSPELDSLHRKLDRTRRERTRLLAGLSGERIPPGPSGSPTPNRPDLLPTGCNFYSRDVRTMPTRTAWKRGRTLAEELLARHRREEETYPERLAVVLWATSNMRTGGTDVAEVFALMGVRPVRSGSDRVTGVEPMSPEEWSHPPVDVVLRISGLFRDSFEPLLDLLREARTVGREARSGETNFLRSSNPDGEARIFGNEPEAYGAGLLPLINQGNWEDRSDLSRAFRRWSRYAYDEQTPREEERELDRALAGVEAVTQNCDTREHDILDSDDYFQFHGGLTAAVAEQSDEEPAAYVTDTSQPEPEVRTLKEETARVFHSRIGHPVWQQAMREHGYKGAFEMGASLDYLFGYDATTGSIPDSFYDRFARDMVLDEETRAFLEEHNPWSLEEMGERLLESHRRGLWEPEDPDILDDIRRTLRESESAREAPVS